MGWTELRPIQSDAIRAVLQSENDLIISAATASGKTEAAFLPIISRLSESPNGSVGALYISPLKALINDQFRRLEELCEYAEIPVHKWHGDVGQGAKAKLVKNPSGIVLTTPESLESMFVNRSSALPRLFGSLGYVVIDELHAFVGRERGTHLRSLLHRLEERIGRKFRLIALSATLGAWERQYANWMRPGDGTNVTVITSQDGEKTIRMFSEKVPRPVKMKVLNKCRIRAMWSTICSRPLGAARVLSSRIEKMMSNFSRMRLMSAAGGLERPRHFLFIMAR
jgi:ATP-dependent Lhr-like helicase